MAHHDMTDSAPFLQSRYGAMMVVVLGCAAYFGIQKLGSDALTPAIESALTLEPAKRTEALATLLTGALSAIVAVAGLWFVLGRLGFALTAPEAWRRPGGPWGWLLAVGLIALSALNILGPLGVYPIFELSAFNLTGSLAGGLIAGTIEEIVFRGFVMDRLRACGWGRVVQVLMAGILFGLAHAGWGSLGGESTDWAFVLGAVANTTILGILFGLAYLAGRRSLWPVIVAHAGINILIKPWMILGALEGKMGG